MSSHTISLPGYHLVALLHTSALTQVYRGWRDRDQLPVVIKVPRHPFPRFEALLQFRNQYTIAKNLPFPQILKPLALEPYEHGYALILEDFQGIALEDVLSQTGAWGKTAATVEQFFAIAPQIIEAVGLIHRQRVIHKDLKPANILINLDTQQIKLTDFSLASLLPRETQELQATTALEGTLAYLAPEQTGRMNRGIDYRSDFYALGATFYHLLTGAPPFVTEDAMELIHCHLAQAPEPIAPRYAHVPQCLSDLVGKLLAKNAEDRYQSTLGLRHDLAACARLAQQSELAATFVLGERDVCDRFLIPEKLYGREPEVQALLTAFERVSAGNTEMMLVSGYSGVGKTAVINEVHKPIVKRRGYFIKGKFDQLNRNTPFSGFVQALRDLLRQLLSESDARLQLWRSRLLTALGESGQVIIDVLPELEAIIGPQPPAVALSGTAAQARFNLLLQQFIQVFTTPEHPVVMFVDDWQWADAASLQLLQVLMTEGATGHLLLLGAYRDNEVPLGHPLLLALDAIAQAEAPVHTIAIQPLNVESLNQLVAATLHCTATVAQPLTQLVHQKTRGNPFFATQFLRALHQDGLMTFDRLAGHWQCDLVQVSAAALTEDVVQFMAAQLQKLPSSTQAMLKLAACVGNSFDLATLAIISEQTEVDAATELWPALQQGLILPQSQIYKFYVGRDLEPVSESRDPSEFLQARYRFLHDRVQQAAYSLIPDAQRQTTHYRIGQLLWQQMSLAERDERIFELVGQLNWGLALVTEEGEREDLAQLNLRAAQKAKAATAYQAGLTYAIAGLDFLGESAWTRQYDLTRALHELAAELASLTGRFAEMEAWIDDAIAHVHTRLEQIPVYRTRIRAQVYQNQLAEAIALGCQVLAQLGVDFPDPVTPDAIQTAIGAILALTQAREISDFARLPAMSDAQSLALVQIASSLLGTAYLSGSPLYPLLVCLCVRLSIEQGNTVASPSCYAFYGAILCNALKDMDTGVQFGQLALAMVEETAYKATKADVISPVVAFILHRKQHLRDLLAIAQAGYTAGLEQGSLISAGYSCILYCIKGFNCGQPLVTLEPEVRGYATMMRRLHQTSGENYCLIVWQSILNLLDTSEEPTIFAGEAIVETEFLPRILAASEPGLLFQFYLYKAILAFWFADIPAAQRHIRAAHSYFTAAVGLVNESTFYFYDSLIALTALTQPAPIGEGLLPSPAEQGSGDEGIVQRVTANQAQLQHNWADHAPMNYQHKVDLVKAELARVQGKPYEAGELYDRAIAGAQAHGYLQEAALAHELAANFYLHWGKDKIATAYLEEAYYGYAQWGAKAKIDDLEHRYSAQLTALQWAQQQQRVPRPVAPDRAPVPLNLNSFTSNNLSHSALDFAAILKAAQALSSEIQLDRLIATLLRVVMENSGGLKAALLCGKQETLRLEAIATLTEAQVTYGSVPLHPETVLPMSIINYVQHSHQAVVLDNAPTEPDWLADPYLRAQQPRSVLCTPISKQGQFIGVLYLENPLTSGVFTRERLEIIHLLCTQAAIALENARLYADVQRSEARYQSLAANVPGMIYQYRLNPDGQDAFTYISPSCEQLFGVPAEDAIATAATILTLVHPDDQAELARSIEESAQTLQPWQWIGRAQLASGELKWIQGLSRPQRQTDGSVVWDGILTDITERKYLEQEQAKLNTILEASTDYIGIADLHGRILWVNQPLKQLCPCLDTDTDQLQHLSIAAFHPTWASEQILQVGLATAAQAGTWLGESAILADSGQEIPVSQLIIAHKAADGSVEYYSTIMRDISERQRAESALRQERNLMSQIMETSPAGIIVLNPDGEIIFANDRAEQILGLGISEVIGRAYNAPEWQIQSLDGSDFPDDQLPFAQVMQTRQTVIGVQHAIQWPNGKRLLLSINGAPLFTAERTIDGVVMTVDDITTAKQFELEREQLFLRLAQLNGELEAANRQLAEYSHTLEQKVAERTAELEAAQQRIITQEKLASLGTLTAGVAHEIRNPLNFVKNYAEGSTELLQELAELLQPLLSAANGDRSLTLRSKITTLLADLQDNATTIRDQSQRAADIISSMMQHSRSDYDSGSLEPASLHNLLDLALKLVTHSKQVEWGRELFIDRAYDRAVAQLDVIPGSLLRAFINLIDNAYDAMRDRQAGNAAQDYQPILQITTRRLVQVVEIRIRDNGCGIEPAIAPQILDPFFTTKPPGKGTGLGLSLTYDIVVKQHQGSLTIDSQPDQFTEVTLCLPG